MSHHRTWLCAWWSSTDNHRSVRSSPARLQTPCGHRNALVHFDRQVAQEYRLPVQSPSRGGTLCTCVLSRVNLKFQVCSILLPAPACCSQVQGIPWSIRAPPLRPLPTPDLAITLRHTDASPHATPSASRLWIKRAVTGETNTESIWHHPKLWRPHCSAVRRFEAVPRSTSPCSPPSVSRPMTPVHLQRQNHLDGYVSRCFA
ncbi:hypothetical protein VTI74DRAFT_1691 [Chaetomium olivicolor]